MIRRLQDTFTINLTQGKQAFVDERDWRELRKHKWFALWHPRRKTFVAARNGRSPSGKRMTVLMHREIMGLKKGDSRQVDHIDRKPLNNRRDNLRVVTNRGNTENRRGQSRYGVGVVKAKGRFGLQIRVGERRHWRTYDTAEEANAAREAFLKEHGLS